MSEPWFGPVDAEDMVPLPGNPQDMALAEAGLTALGKPPGVQGAV